MYSDHKRGPHTYSESSNPKGTVYGPIIDVKQKETYTRCLVPNPFLGGQTQIVNALPEVWINVGEAAQRL